MGFLLSLCCNNRKVNVISSLVSSSYPQSIYLSRCTIGVKVSMFVINLKLFNHYSILFTTTIRFSYKDYVLSCKYDDVCRLLQIFV